jgi:hypothetical protein
MYKILKSMVIAGLLVSLSAQLPLAAAQQQEVEQQKKVSEEQQDDGESIFTLKNLLIVGGVITAGAIIGVTAAYFFPSNNDNESYTGFDDDSISNVLNNIHSDGDINIVIKRGRVGTNITGRKITINGKDYSPLPQKFSSKETHNVEDTGDEKLSKIVIKNTCGDVTVKQDTTLKNVVIDIERRSTKEEDLKKLNVTTEKVLATISGEPPCTLFVTSKWDTSVIQNARINYLIKVPKGVQDSEVTTSRGNITVSGLPGKHDLTSFFGDIGVSNSGNIFCKAGSGKIDLKNVGSVEFESSFGKTEIQESGDIKGNSKSGDAVFNAVGGVEFNSGLGKTTINGAKKVVVISKSGDLDLKNVGDVNFESSFGNTEIQGAGNVKGSSKSGDAAFNKVGDITFDSDLGETFINGAEDVTVTSDSGDISLKNVTGKGLASAKFGNITIKNSPNTTGTTKSGRVKKE